jgi:cytosine deaminase
MEEDGITLESEDKENMDEFMQAAIEEAQQGRAEGGIPIGSVLVRNGQIIGRGHNRRVQEGDPMKHAEIDCLMRAGRIGGYRDTVLYSTLMPCYLCAGAVVQFRIPKVIVGEARTFAGAEAFLRAQGVEVINMDLDECAAMMEAFIKANPSLWNEDIGE